jgi:pimeloyl-ACP methyl ester carboxylesterase
VRLTLDHRNPRQGFERTLTLRTLTPLARAGFQVYFTNRWPDMAPGATFAEVAERHAAAILDHFGKPVDVLGASTGGSLALQLIADRPDVVRKAVVACAAYTLGPVAKERQLKASACNFRDRSLSHPGHSGRNVGEAPIALAPYVAYASRVCGGQANHDRESGRRNCRDPSRGRL